MKQIWVPYWEWEDYLSGMWRKIPKNEEIEMLEKCVEFTGNWIKYGSFMERVVKAWPRTMLNSLSNPSVNKRAFIGHCACCLAFGCPEYITRQAWKLLTEKQRIDADDIAEICYAEWKDQRLRSEMGAKMLSGTSGRITAGDLRHGSVLAENSDLHFKERSLFN